MATTQHKIRYGKDVLIYGDNKEKESEIVGYERQTDSIKPIVILANGDRVECNWPEF